MTDKKTTPNRKKPLTLDDVAEQTGIERAVLDAEIERMGKAFLNSDAGKKLMARVEKAKKLEAEIAEHKRQSKEHWEKAAKAAKEIFRWPFKRK